MHSCLKLLNDPMLSSISSVSYSSVFKCLCLLSNIQLASSNGNGPGSADRHAERIVKLEEEKHDLRERWCWYFNKILSAITLMS